MGTFTKVRRFFMLTCQDVNAFIVDYLDGALDRRTRRRFEKHISQCVICRTYLDQYRQTIDLVRTEGDTLTDPPDELVAMTLDFLRDHYDAAPPPSDGS